MFKSRSSHLIISIVFACIVVGLSVIVQHPAERATSLEISTPDTIVPGGTLITNTTWTLAASPYIVQGSVFIPTGITLTIQPGVEVQFDGGGFILRANSGGTLDAQGTAAQPITFTSAISVPHAGDWSGIQALGGGNLQLDFCDVAYAGSSGANGTLDLETSAAQVSNCRIHDGATAGIYLSGVGITPTLQSVQVDHNAGLGVNQSTLDMNPTYHNLMLANNGTDAVAVASGNASHPVVLDGSPAALNGAPIILPGVGLYAGSVLTITPGTRLLMQANSTLDVYQGALNAVGTTDQPITFTSVMTTPHAGDWRGIVLRSAQPARLGYCDLSEAGGSTASSVLEIDTPATQVQVNNCRIHDGAADWPLFEWSGHHADLAVGTRGSQFGYRRRSESTGHEPGISQLSADR